jgi:protein phosphatase 2C
MALWGDIASIQDRGGREYMEDRMAILPPTRSQPIGICAVFDGHNGHEVAQICSETMPAHLIRQAGDSLKADSPDAPTSIAKSFSFMDDEVRRKGVADNVGSTACVALIGPQMIWVANAGDSRAVLRTAHGVLDLSKDHKPMRGTEYDRITSAGGHLTFGDCPRVMGTLNLSRSIGDLYMRPYVISTPEVSRVALTPSDRFLLLATDGLWDVVTSEEAALMLDTHPQAGLKKLLRIARERGSTDNFTALYVPLRVHMG